MTRLMTLLAGCLCATQSPAESVFFDGRSSAVTEELWPIDDPTIEIPSRDKPASARPEDRCHDNATDLSFGFVFADCDIDGVAQFTPDQPGAALALDLIDEINAELATVRKTAIDLTLPYLFTPRPFTETNSTPSGAFGVEVFGSVTRSTELVYRQSTPQFDRFGDIAVSIEKHNMLDLLPWAGLLIDNWRYCRFELSERPC